jgi:hypothetical protein
VQEQEVAQVQEAAAMAQVQEVAQVQEAAVSQEQEVAQEEVQEAAKVVHVFIHSLLCARATSRASPSTKGRWPSK